MSDLFKKSARSPETLTRRRFLRLGAFSAALVSLPGAAFAGLRLPSAARSLAFYNTHTGETLKTVYWENGRYVSGSLREIDHILRDFRVNEIRPIEPSLLDLLHVIGGKLDTPAPFHIISGYRSAATNAMLASHSEGVARHSLHQYGKAIDIRVPGRELSTVRRVALAMRGGGVGYYPRPDFVHVDVGRVRYW